MDHNEKIIRRHLDSLDKQLREKDLYSFCVFPEQGFRNRMTEGIKEIKKYLKKNPGKHNYLACIRIATHHKDRDSIQGRAGVWLYADIGITPINKEGELQSSKGFGITMHWKEEDLKITKLSLKMLEDLMQIALKKKLTIAAVFGVPFNRLIKKLKYREIDISEHLRPLAGLK